MPFRLKEKIQKLYTEYRAIVYLIKMFCALGGVKHFKFKCLTGVLMG